MSDTESRAGTRFGPYQLVRLLGSGGMGEVYEAKDTRKNRVVALKLISQQYSSNSVYVARMRREADTAGRLTEPHIVPIHDYGEIDGQFYVEMRMIDGISLGRMLKRFGPLAPARAVAIVRQIAAGLDAAHDNHVTHRDVKPENILITRDDFAYLVDFGLARVATDPGLTHAGMAVGTHNYMAPECFSAKEVTHRADIYALACVLNECLTGAPPYQSNSMESLIAAHLLQPAPRPSQLRPGKIPVAFDQVIAKGMAKNPEDRYLSAGDLADAAHGALTTTEQHQEATILRQGDNANLVAKSADASTNALGTGPDAKTMDSGPSGRQAVVGPEPSISGSGSWPQSGVASVNPNTGPPPTQIGTTIGPAGWPSQVGVPPATPNTGPPPTQIGTTIGPAGWPSQVGVPPATPNTGPPPTQIGTTIGPTSGPSQAGAPPATPDRGHQQTRIGPTSWPSQAGVPPSVDSGVSPTQDKPSQPEPTTKPRKNRKLGIVAAAATVVLVVAAGVILFVMKPSGSSASAHGQSVVPFNGLNFRLSPGGVAVDSSGTVYVSSQTMKGRVVTLAAGSTSPNLLPLGGLYEPQGLAVGSSGKVYVTDFNNRVVVLAPGSNNQTELPFDGLSYPEGVAVDAQGNVYVADRGNNRVVKLAAGSNTQTVLGFNGLKNPDGVVVDSIGNVYVTDTDNNRVLKLDAGTSNQSVLPLGDITTPWGITVDNSGNIYVTEHDSNAVVKLAAGATSPTQLPFTGLNTPLSVAVDKDGNVYVADRGNGRVVKYTP